MKCLTITACLFGIVAMPAAAVALPFCDYGSGDTSKLVAGAATWRLSFGQGPWVWFPRTAPSLLDTTVTGVLDLHTTGPTQISPDLIATLPIAAELTLSAHEPGNEANILGTMVLSGTGVNVVDINAARVFVDPQTGMFMAPFGKPLHAGAPEAVLTLDQATGVFADIVQVGPWDWNMAGWYAAPLIEGMPLQQNIFTALGGGVPLIGGFMDATISGQYIPEPATLGLLLAGWAVMSRKRRA